MCVIILLAAEAEKISLGSSISVSMAAIGPGVLYSSSTTGVTICVFALRKSLTINGELVILFLSNKYQTY